MSVGGVRHVIQHNRAVTVGGRVRHVVNTSPKGPNPRRVCGQPLTTRERDTSDVEPSRSITGSRELPVNRNPRNGPVSADQVAQMLDRIPADDRELWVKLGFAVFDLLGEAGRSVWMRWSATSPKFRAKDAEAVWRSVQRPGGVKGGTLFAVAKEYGWGGSEPVMERRAPDPWERERDRRRAQDRERRAREAATTAQQMIRGAKLERHPYLDRKKLDREGLVLDGKLLVPMRNARTDEVQGVQVIDADGGKKFQPAGCRASEACAKFGVRRAKLVVYCEGWATALSIHAALESVYCEALVIACFSAHSLSKLAHQWRGRTCLVVGDADSVGRQAAQDTGLPTWEPPTGDASDHYMEHGPQALGRALLQAIRTS